MHDVTTICFIYCWSLWTKIIIKIVFSILAISSEGKRPGNCLILLHFGCDCAFCGPHALSNYYCDFKFSLHLPRLQMKMYPSLLHDGWAMDTDKGRLFWIISLSETMADIEIGYTRCHLEYSCTMHQWEPYLAGVVLRWCLTSLISIVHFDRLFLFIYFLLSLLRLLRHWIWPTVRRPTIRLQAREKIAAVC